MPKIPVHYHTPSRFAKLNAFLDKPAFSKAYLVIAGIILFGTTTFWSYLASLVHQNNADQLSNSYLFDTYTTFQTATMPGQHSFLFKWPLFFLVRLFGSTELAFTLFTIVTALTTVGLFVYILSRINRKPLVIGTIMLALASVLLFVPAESYPGALLPVNLAMIANRNLEYILYILSLILMIRSRYLLTWRNGAAVLLMTLLIASDKLFMAMSLGGGLLALVIYLVQRRRTSVYLALRWLVTTVIATLLATGLLWAISAYHLTNIANGSTAGPYGIAYHGKDIAFGAVYGALGILTNLGANPVSDVVVVKDLASQLVQRALSASMIGYGMNLIIALVGVIVGYRLLITNPLWRPNKHKTAVAIDVPIQLSQTLIYTTLAAVAVFIVSNHYYAVDARYLTIVLFAVFVAITTFLRRSAVQSYVYVLAGVLLVISIIVGVGVSWRTTQLSLAAQSGIAQRNDLIVAALSQHPVDNLIGDYWRVYPIKLESQQQNIIPMASCTTIRDTLASKAWQQGMATRSFAYVLSLENSVTNYPACTINQVVATYGRPNSTQVIAGTINKPKEVLLFYDYGTNTHTTISHPSLLLQPRLLSQLPNTQCDSQTILNIVAHQDDDLLFTTPDLIHSIRAGNCIRSIYLTAGDAGSGKLYWLSREQGSEAAYAEMIGIKNPNWISRTIQVSDTGYATVAFLPNNTHVSLVFLHLPDGGIDGRGFHGTRFESMSKLETGKISRIHAVDGQSVYTSDQLTSALANLIDTYMPNEIHTQATHNLSKQYFDHSDHLITGKYAQLAYQQNVQSNASHPDIKFYIGYPIRDRPENVSGADLQDKQKAFFTYAHYDKGTCESMQACSKMSYSYYLKRQYQDTP